MTGSDTRSDTRSGAGSGAGGPGPGGDRPLVAPPGLRGVVVADTAIGDVRGTEGFYHYRQYSAVDLARSRTFEDVWHLFFEGRLPDRAERDAFAARVAALREVPAEVAALLGPIARAEPPLLGWRTALSLLAGVRGLAPTWDGEPEQWAADALSVCAVTPTILAALHRSSLGLAPVPPRADLSTAANWLYMITGEVPEPRHVRAIERYLIATVDHGFNASTFTARVVASTGADVASAVVGAIGAFSGPLHGGAPDRALDGLDEIGDPANAPDWVRAKLAAGDRVMGFGHAVYRTEDPRSVLLREVATELGGDLAQRAVAVEDAVVRTLAELKPGRALYANVEFYAGVVMAACGIPRTMFTPTFAVSRVVGWCAHVLEQAAESKIIRPAARYVGPPPPEPVPVLA